MCAPDLEDRIHQIGHAIFRRAGSLSGFASPIAKIDQAVMSWTMRDESFKSQLFRFVDCLPSLRSSDEIARHLREYLNIHLPGLSSLLAAAARVGAGRMARKFIAAADLDQAVRTIARLRRHHLAFTLDLLGEAVISESEADQYQQKYLRLTELLPARLAGIPEDPQIDRCDAGPIPRANISIKLSSLYSQFDPLDSPGTINAVLRRLRPILRLARKHGVFVNLDMEQFAFKDLTLQAFKSVLLEDEFRDWNDVGIAIQAYLRCALDDLHDLRNWSSLRGTPVWIRLVKGAYWDFETIIAAQNDWPVPVFTEKADTDANFEAAAKFLVQNRRLLRPAIASHNVRSIAAAIADARHFGAKNSEIEFQMLFGMADPLKTTLAEMNYRVRVYCPVGQPLPGMAYLVRRLLENTSNESFLRAGFIDHAPEEQLLMNPRLLKPVSRSSKPPTPDFINEPLTDFSRPESRNAMASAWAKFSARPCADYPLLIANRPIFTSRWIESINPSHKSQTVARCACALADHADQSVAAAQSAFSTWRNVSPAGRASLLDRVAEILRRDRFDLAAIEIAECGKPWREADADIAEAIDFCRYYALQMRSLASGASADVPGETNEWLYESRGPAVVIAPWNFPLAILTGMAAAAVVAGNPVILKPAEQSPLIAYHLARAFEEAGAPAGVVNYLPGIGEEIGPKLVSHPDVALIAFTGSKAVGLSINYLAAQPQDNQHLVKRVIVEMGGKNAIIIDADADLDDAVSGVLASAFGYSGQKCSACSRVVVLAPVHDAFLRRLIDAASSLKIAPAEDPACRIGPVIDLDAQQRILAALERGKRDARLAFAGDIGALANEGFYVAPHIFADVPPSSPLASEEIFGPVLAIMKVETLDEALAIANGVQYALTGGIFSRSPVNIARARREFRVGNLYINRKITGALVGRQPFGGFKLSGGGTQAGGPDYLRHFLIPRCITENVLRHGFAADSDPK
jgi:RHH-type proline utilization regulon transcriptional repressor/proline dehydrogenase/delta 1-pyrroline-5-carboxylate dehydrogenase